MKSTEMLIKMGIEPDSYPADACFGESIIGTYSIDMKTVCIMLEDNLSESDMNDINKCLLSKEIVEEIAYTVDTLITNFGCEVHSYTMGNVRPFDRLKIKKTVSEW